MHSKSLNKSAKQMVNDSKNAFERKTQVQNTTEIYQVPTSFQKRFQNQK